MNSFDYNNKGHALEQGVLSILLCNESILKESELDANMFADELHKRMYRTMKDIVNQKGTFDLIEFASRSKDIYGIIDYVVELQDMYCSSSNFYSYVDDLQDICKKRLAKTTLEKCENEELTYDEMVSEISKIGASFQDDSNATMMSSMEMYELITTDSAKLKFHSFSNMQSKIGFIENTLNIIAARTSVGKSSLALNLMNDLAIDYKCLYMNMEMTEKELYQRLASINSGVPINEFTSLKKSQDKHSKVVQAINVVRNKKIKIYNGSKSVDGIRKIIARESREGHCIVFVDYIGYVTTRKKQNDRERIGEATRELQIMSKDFNCTIFILAQINREGTEAPTLTHLKDSGELEQSGHVILILHNPSTDINNQYPIYDAIVAKNRSGKLGKIQMKFEKPTQRFEVL